jgi:mRNA-degrading endonuclease toxin of MazEF toxin-antitoxin module
MLRGEIWLGIWPNDPEQKPRPLLIVSNNLRNQAPNLLDINVVKLTSLQNSNGKDKPINPSEDVVITLKKPTIIRSASIFTIEKSSLTRKLVQLSVADMLKVDSCLKTVLNLN